MTTPADPDLRHLADLLDLLPGPDDPYFWKDLPGEKRTGYVFEKLVPKIPLLGQPEPKSADIAQLAEYLMMFFVDTPAMHDHVGRQTGVSPYELMGQHWINDLQATCWRLYVRHRNGKRHLGTWPENFSEWWEERRTREREQDQGA